ncbi:MAG: amidohydrolase family protein [Solirubrobacterales bacterium]
MNPTTIESERDEVVGGPGRIDGLIDCDVHPVIGDVSVLRPHMSARAARRAFGADVPVYSRDPNRIPHPSSGLRLDALTPSGGPPGSDPAFAVEQWIDPCGIAAAVLIPVQAGLVIPWGDEAAGSEFLAAMNTFLLDEWTGLDSRLRSVISISPYDVDGAIAEIERLAEVPGIAGVFIPAGAVPLGSSRMFGVYEIAEHHGLPILLHPTGAEANFAEAPRIAGGSPDTYPERHAMLAQPGQQIFTSMIFGGVFDRFPGLKLVLVEYGVTWAGPLLWRMERAYDQGDGELAGIKRRPSEYLDDNVRFTTQPLDEPPNREMLWTMLDMMHAERTLMFSSDYPHWDTDDPTTILSSRLPERLRRPIATDNAIECFGPRLGL